jgi:hypothetical protein
LGQCYKCEKGARAFYLEELLKQDNFIKILLSAMSREGLPAEISVSFLHSQFLFDSSGTALFAAIRIGQNPLET